MWLKRHYPMSKRTLAVKSEFFHLLFVITCSNNTTGVTHLCGIDTCTCLDTDIVQTRMDPALEALVSDLLYIEKVSTATLLSVRYIRLMDGWVPTITAGMKPLTRVDIHPTFGVWHWLGQQRLDRGQGLSCNNICYLVTDAAYSKEYRHADCKLYIPQVGEGGKIANVL